MNFRIPGDQSPAGSRSPSPSSSPVSSRRSSVSSSSSSERGEVQTPAKIYAMALRELREAEAEVPEASVGNHTFEEVQVTNQYWSDATWGAIGITGLLSVIAGALIIATAPHALIALGIVLGGALIVVGAATACAAGKRVFFNRDPLRAAVLRVIDAQNQLEKAYDALPEKKKEKLKFDDLPEREKKKREKKWGIE